YDQRAQRIEKAIEYVPLEELDKAMEKGKIPAATVIPLRMVVIHAEVPYKRELEEMKRALRLSSVAEAAAKWPPKYDGYEVQRKVTRIGPDGKPELQQDWAEYKFEDKYVELINSRKFADAIEEGYITYFLRYEMALALPLPELVKELGAY